MQGAAGCGGRGWRGSGQRGVAPSAVHEWWRNSRGEAGDARRSRACARFPAHLAGSRMTARGLRLPSPAAGASCQLAVAERGACAKPTKPGGGGCLKGCAPKLTASSTFFRQMAGYSAWPCMYCRAVQEGGSTGRHMERRTSGLGRQKMIDWAGHSGQDAATAACPSACPATQAWMPPRPAPQQCSRQQTCGSWKAGPRGTPFLVKDRPPPWQSSRQPMVSCRPYGCGRRQAGSGAGRG